MSPRLTPISDTSVFQFSSSSSSSSARATSTQASPYSKFGIGFKQKLDSSYDVSITVTKGAENYATSVALGDNLPTAALGDSESTSIFLLKPMAIVPSFPFHSLLGSLASPAAMIPHLNCPPTNLTSHQISPTFSPQLPSVTIIPPFLPTKIIH